MNSLTRILICIFLVLGPLAKAQHGHNIDSLLNRYAKTKSVVDKFNLQLEIADVYKNTGDYLRCRDYIDKAKKTAKDEKSKAFEMRALLAEGELLLQQGQYAGSVKAFFSSLKIARAIKDKQAEGRLLDQIGIVYWYEGQLKKGLGYLEEAYKISEEGGDLNSMSGILNNLGLIYRKQGDFEKAEKYYLESAELCRKLDKQDGLADVLNNIAIIHQLNADFEEAEKYHIESLKIRESLDDKIGIATSLGNLGELYVSAHQTEEGKKYLFRALELSESIDDLQGIVAVASTLSDVYVAAGDGLKALEYYKKYTEAQNKLNNAVVEKETYQQELANKYEREKLSAKKEQEKRNIQAEALRKKQDVIIYASLGGLAIVLVFSVFLFNRFRITKKQKKLIELQKKEVEAKNHEIIDSINYAKRLQDAILPPVKLFEEQFSDAFVMYRPKDIVAGDFYFLETVGDLKIFGVADCTGHGVPGALVSVVCSTALHRAIKEFNILEPGLLLNKVTELVLQTFEKSVSEVKDGMDISLCVFDGKQRQLKWAGANNPLWIVRKETGMEEFKADKQAIGYVEKPKPFNTHVIDLKEGDAVYLFSDGYPDQFGGPDGKKYMYRNFQRKIASISTMRMNEQLKVLTDTFDEWKERRGNENKSKAMEQTDDVCVIGIRI